MRELSRGSGELEDALRAAQWVVLPAVPAAWLIFGFLLCLATVVTKNIIQPPLYSHRPIPVFSCEFLRWWLVQRLIGVTNLMFADQLRGTAYLAWWFRALVSPISPPHLFLSNDKCDKSSGEW